MSNATENVCPFNKISFTVTFNFFNFIKLLLLLLLLLLLNNVYIKIIYFLGYF